MVSEQRGEQRDGYCPVYDIECPAGSAAAESCELRFTGNYNPLTNLRDAEIEHCAIYRQKQQAQEQLAADSASNNMNKVSKDGE